MAKKRTDPMRGIYLRGNTYWLAVQKNRKREFMTLETRDPGEALRKAAQIRQAGALNAGSPLKDEISRFIDYKQRMNAYTASTALTKRNKLLLFAHAMPEHASAATTTVRNVQSFYDAIRARVTDTTAQGYMMAARAFFRWAVETAHIASRNPVKDVRLAKSKGRARKDFCGFELREKLIANAPNDELRFILYCGFHAGLRFQEIVEARPFWFDLEGIFGLTSATQRSVGNKHFFLLTASSEART